MSTLQTIRITEVFWMHLNHCLKLIYSDLRDVLLDTVFIRCIRLKEIVIYKIHVFYILLARTTRDVVEN